MNEMPLIEKNALAADNGWAGLLFLVVFLIFGLVLALYGHQYYKRMKLLNLGRTRIVEYDDNVANWISVSLLWMAAVVGMALTVSVIIARLSHSTIDSTTFLVTLGVTAVYIASKFGIMYLMKYTFDVESPIFIEEMKIIVILFALVSTLAGMGFAYYSSIWVGVAVCSISLLAGLVIEAVLLVKNFYKEIGSSFYIFLYLCAAEILPLFIGANCISKVLN